MGMFSLEEILTVLEISWNSQSPEIMESQLNFHLLICRVMNAMTGDCTNSELGNYLSITKPCRPQCDAKHFTYITGNIYSMFFDTCYSIALYYI